MATDLTEQEANDPRILKLLAARRIVHVQGLGWLAVGDNYEVQTVSETLLVRAALRLRTFWIHPPS